MLYIFFMDFITFLLKLFKNFQPTAVGLSFNLTANTIF